MNLSRREMVMAVVTLLIVVVGGTLLLGRPLWTKWKNAAVQRQRLADENRLSARLIRQREEVATKLDTIRSRLPRFKPGQPVTAELLKTVKRLADENQVAITRIEPDPEQQVGDLSEVAIDCQWDATLEGMVKFLYAVQVQGAILDIRQITVAPAQGAAGRLKGNFTVFCAFSRTEDDPPPAAAAGPADAVAPAPGPEATAPAPADAEDAAPPAPADPVAEAEKANP